MGNTAKTEQKDIFNSPCTSSNLVPGTFKTAKITQISTFLDFQQENGVKNGVTFKKFRSLCMATRKLKLYKNPKIVRCKNGDWYVGYYFRDPKNPVKWLPEFKERCQLNYIKNIEEKESQFEILRLDVLSWLRSGNTPFDKDAVIEDRVETMEARIELEQKVKEKWSIATAINKFIGHLEDNVRNEKKLDGFSERTIETYRNYLAGFKTWCLENELLQKEAWLFNEFELEQFLNDRGDFKEWSGRTYNNYLEFFGGFFAKCGSMENRDLTKAGELKITYQLSIEDVERKKVTMQRNKPFTTQMAEKLKKAMDIPERKNLREYCEWIAMSMMRPDEIRHLKVENIDTVARQIRIIGKTGERLVPISDQLLNLIIRRGVLTADQNSFVFGYAGTLDQRRISVQYFLEQFAEVRPDVGLGPEYGPYNFKHTYAQAMARAGFKEEEIMMLTGHKTVEAFRAYMAGFNIDHSHVMKGSTIDF